MKYPALVRTGLALVVLLVALVPTSLSAQGKWWQSERYQRELQLTSDQIGRIEEVFRSALPELRRHKKALDQLETELSRLIDASADEAAVMRELDRVESLRTELSKTRTLMLLRIRRVLTSEQRERLSVLHQEWERERKHQDRRR